MKKVIKFIYLLSIILLPYAGFASIITVNSINSPFIKNLKDFADNETIIFINLDEVLTTPKSLMFRYNSVYKNFISELEIKIKKGQLPKLIIENWYKQRSIKLVEEQWPQLINLLKSKGAKIYGICSMPFYMKDMEKVRINEIRKLGINFNEKTGEQNVIKIGEKNNRQSLFYVGVIFTGPFGKAESIVKFLKINNIFPKKVIVFDSIKFNLKEIDQALKLYDMEFYNVEYSALNNMIEPIDYEVIKFQQQQLIMNQIWIEDDDAKAKMKTMNK